MGSERWAVDGRALTLLTERTNEGDGTRFERRGRLQSTSQSILGRRRWNDEEGRARGQRWWAAAPLAIVGRSPVCDGCRNALVVRISSDPLWRACLASMTVERVLPSSHRSSFGAPARDMQSCSAGRWSAHRPARSSQGPKAFSARESNPALSRASDAARGADEIRDSLLRGDYTNRYTSEEALLLCSGDGGVSAGGVGARTSVVRRRETDGRKPLESCRVLRVGDGLVSVGFAMNWGVTSVSFR